MEYALKRYVKLLDELLWRRAIGQLDDDSEELLIVALNDCRLEMSPNEEKKIEDIVDRRMAIVSSTSLGIVDTEIPMTDDSPLQTPLII